MFESPVKQNLSSPHPS